VRVYWNCTPLSAPAVLRSLTFLLGPRAEHPFMIKTPAASAHTGRADAMVLYLGPQSFHHLDAEFRSVATELSRQLREATPRLTRRIGSGVAVAEARLDGESFGRPRCESIADAYLAADGQARHSPHALVRIIAHEFASRGIDPARPDLEPASAS